MKKYLAMIALSVAVAGTVNAQNTAPRERNNTYRNPSEQNRSDKNTRGEFKRNKDRKMAVSPEQRATQRTEMLAQKLDLSSKQKKQLQALNLKQAQQMTAYRNQNQKPGNSYQKQDRQKMHASYEKELKGILSKKQYAKYEEDRQQMQAQRNNRGGRDVENNARFRRNYNG